MQTYVEDRLNIADLMADLKRSRCHRNSNLSSALCTRSLANLGLHHNGQTI
jgi:predicted DNA-binding ribbon-helix-helix protein